MPAASAYAGVFERMSHRSVGDEDRQYDLILMDLMMPNGLDGLQTSALIRQSMPHFAAVPIVSVSAHYGNFFATHPPSPPSPQSLASSTLSHHTHLDPTISAWLAKPVDPTALASVLSALALQ